MVVVQVIKVVREYGDLLENFEYYAAKNEQGMLEAWIRTLRSRLDHLVLVDELELALGEVGVGSMVEIEDEQGQRMELEISSVGGGGMIFFDLSLGCALVGHHKKNTITIDT